MTPLRCFVFACLVVVKMPAAESTLTAQSAQATYSGGECQLRVLTVTQRRAALDSNNHTLALAFRLEYPSTRPLPPPDVFLNNEKSPLVTARVDGRNVAELPHFGFAQGRPVAVMISDLKIGPSCESITDVDIELVFLRVTEWDRLKFEIGAGESDYLHCGPFEFKVTGEQKRIRVVAWSWPEFRAEHDAFYSRVPLKFLNDGFGLTAAKLVDAKGRSAAGLGLMTSRSDGPSESSFLSWASYDEKDAAIPDVTNPEPAYPVTISLNLPKAYRTEKVSFHFDKIAVPPPQ
jgi:hypothetical protein